MPQPQPNHNTNQNQNPSPSVQKLISNKIRIQPVYVVVVIRGGAKIGEDGPFPNVRLISWRKVKFDVEEKK